jgi:LAO/AO transport system kinase
MIDDLVARARAGDARSIARLITRIENGGEQAREVLQALSGVPSSARVVGITGAPGAGKSTTLSALIGAYRQRGERVGVLAVDPSSPFTGGALLGDRIRMQQHATDPGVYIRSMASRGHLGGLAAATGQAAEVLQAVGFDVVVVETVGVGQSEVEIAGAADTSVVLVAPGMGDSIQAAKAGILEIGDVFAVNKADRDGADATARELRHMIDLGLAGGWKPPVVKTIASTGEGIDGLVAAIDDHGRWLASSGEQEQRRLRRIREQVIALVLGEVRERIDQRRDEVDRLCHEVLAGRCDAFAAAQVLAHRASTGPGPGLIEQADHVGGEVVGGDVRKADVLEDIAHGRAQGDPDLA